nr:MAG TPA: hypothetical protein [Caudoviricetes sp.]
MFHAGGSTKPANKRNLTKSCLCGTMVSAVEERTSWSTYSPSTE